MNAWGDADSFRLIRKESDDESERTIDAMEIDGAGVLVRSTMRRSKQVATALAFVPGVKIVEDGGNGAVTSRRLVAIAEKPKAAATKAAAAK